ncbi:hypothetical protein BaRGS_00037691 [Batillaria attramentaria]|uniref:Uncharacterized protein n=1 Tax=Batillaria attramentaria TaxID=370345 RepID=A0ABD0J7U8_9CAEN
MHPNLERDATNPMRPAEVSLLFHPRTPGGELSPRCRRRKNHPLPGETNTACVVRVHVLLHSLTGPIVGYGSKPECECFSV